MARRRTEDDVLEPILPKHPPVAPEPAPSDAEVSLDPPAAGGRPSWERWLLLACAVVATLALVVCALRLNAIAEDERLQACQVEVYIGEQVRDPRGRFDADEEELRDQLARCIGIDHDADTDDD